MPGRAAVSNVRIATALCAAGFALFLSAPAHAQGAVPITSGEIVPGSECVTARRAVDFLGQIIATPVNGDPYVAPTAVPDGQPVDEQTAAEIGDAIRQFLSCSNSGDVLRALSLFSDEYLRRVTDPSGELDVDTANELVEPLATPLALTDEQRVVFIALHEMVLLDDGTVAVVLETDGGDPDPEGTDVDLFIVERLDNRWIIIDALNDIDDIEAANSGEDDS